MEGLILKDTKCPTSVYQMTMKLNVLPSAQPTVIQILRFTALEEWMQKDVLCQIRVPMLILTKTVQQDVQQTVKKMKYNAMEDMTIKMDAKWKIFAFQLKAQIIALVSVLPSVVQWSKCVLEMSMLMVVINLISVFLLILTILTEPSVLYIVARTKNYALEVKQKQITVCQLMLNPHVVSFANPTVDMMKYIVMDRLMITVVKGQVGVNHTTQLQFVITNVQSTAHKTNGHVSWDRTIGVAKIHRPAQWTVNAPKSQHKT